MRDAITQKELDKALLDAARNNSRNEAARLIAAGARVAVADGSGWRPLHFAAAYGHKDVAKLLVARGAPVDIAARSCWQPLHLAALNGHVEVAMILLDAGADADAVDSVQRRPLHLAAANGQGRVVKLLLLHGADPLARNHDGKTPRAVCRNGRTRALLLKAEREWKGPDARKGEAFAEALAAIRARQRKLGGLRPKGPSL